MVGPVERHIFATLFGVLQDYFKPEQPLKVLTTLSLKNL
jgi:hypothetical protein